MKNGAYYCERLTDKKSMVNPGTFGTDYYGYPNAIDCTLYVTENKWELKFVKSVRTGRSPMGRNIHFENVSFVIAGKDIDKYIQELPESFEKYLLLKKEIPSDIDYTTTTKLGTKISVGKRSDGVGCLQGYIVGYRTKEQIQKIIDLFEYAKKKAEEKMIVLKELSKRGKTAIASD